MKKAKVYQVRGHPCRRRFRLLVVSVNQFYCEFLVLEFLSYAGEVPPAVSLDGCWDAIGRQVVVTDDILYSVVKLMFLLVLDEMGFAGLLDGDLEF